MLGQENLKRVPDGERYDQPSSEGKERGLWTLVYLQMTQYKHAAYVS